MVALLFARIRSGNEKRGWKLKIGSFASVFNPNLRCSQECIYDGMLLLKGYGYAALINRA